MMISISYLTLGIFESDKAASLWEIYSLVVTVLVSLNLLVSRR